jgi:hypothetical protein
MASKTVAKRCGQVFAHMAHVSDVTNKSFLQRIHTTRFINKFSTKNTFPNIENSLREADIYKIRL